MNMACTGEKPALREKPRNRSIALWTALYSTGVPRKPRRNPDRARGPLPQLVELSDLRGDLHVHTNATDGHNTLHQMAMAAGRMVWEYIAITDHSRRLTVASGLDPLRWRVSARNRCPQRKAGRITLLKGIEVDILEDGSLDLPDHVLPNLTWFSAPYTASSNCREQGRRNAFCVP